MNLEKSHFTEWEHISDLKISKKNKLIRTYYPASLFCISKIICTIDKLHTPKGRILTRFFKYEKGN